MDMAHDMHGHDLERDMGVDMDMDVPMSAGPESAEANTGFEYMLETTSADDLVASLRAAKAKYQYCRIAREARSLVQARSGIARAR